MLVSFPLFKTRAVASRSPTLPFLFSGVSGAGCLVEVVKSSIQAGATPKASRRGAEAAER